MTRGTRAYALQITLRAGGLLAMAAFFAVAAREVSPDEFADYVVALAIYSIAVVLSDFGVSQTAVVDLASGDHDSDEVTGAMVRALLVTTSVAVLIAGAVGSAISGGVGLLLLAMLPSFLASQAQIPFMVACQRRHAFGRVGMAETVGRAVALAVLVGLAVFSGGLEVGWVILASTVGVVAQLAGLLGPLTGSVRHASGTVALLKRSLSLGLTNAAAYLHVRIDQILLAVLSTSAVVASYAVAYRVVDAALGLVSAVSILGLPLLAGADVVGRRSVARNLHSLLLVLASLGAMAAFLLADPLARLLGGRGYEDAAPLLRALTPAIWIAVVNLIGALVLVAERQTRVLVGVGAATVSLNVVLNLVLIPLWDGEGAALATTASEALGAVVVGVVAARRLGGVYSLPVIVACAVATVVGTVGAAGAWSQGLAPLAVVLVAAAAVTVMWLAGGSAAFRELMARRRDARADDELIELDDPVVRDLA